jgi:hypothetical protein
MKGVRIVLDTGNSPHTQEQIMPKRVVVLKEEADRLVDETLATTKSVRKFKGRKDLGLYTWTPEPWNSSVDDTDRLYFFWLYSFYLPTVNQIGAKKVVTKEKTWIIVGTSPKSSRTVAHEGDMELEVFSQHDHGHCTETDLWEGLKKTKTRDLYSMGLKDLEILALFGVSPSPAKV